MHVNNKGRGSYGYSYIMIPKGSSKENKFIFWFKTPEARDKAMQKAEKPAGSKEWKKVN